MNKKTYLEAPLAELIVVRFEANILSGPGSADDGLNPKNDLGGLGDEDDEDEG